MSPTLQALAMIVATVLMLLSGFAKKRLEWKPRRGRKPPSSR